MLRERCAGAAMKSGAAAQAEVFRAGVDVEYRSFANPRPVSGKLKYDKPSKTLVVDVLAEMDVLDRQTNEKVEKRQVAPLLLKDMAQVKPRDYADGQSFEFGICLTQKNGDIHSIVFKRVDERDLFANELKNALRTTMRAEEQDSAPVNEQFRTIIKVEVKEPPPAGNVAWLDITLDSGKSVVVAMKENTLPSTFKEHVGEVVNENHILPTEATSLYRLVKALTSRKQVKEEAEKAITEIDSLNFDTYARAHVVQQPAEGQQLEVNLLLDKLKKDLPAKLGSAGVGSQLVHGLLVHNVEKMKAINDMTSKFRFKEHQREERRKMAASAGFGGQSDNSRGQSPGGPPAQRR